MTKPSHAADSRVSRSRVAGAVLAGVVLVALVVAGLSVTGQGSGENAGDPAASDAGGSDSGGSGSEAGDGGVFQRPLATFDDGTRRLADYQGQPLVVNFFASWCPPCVAEMRDAFQPVHAELGDDVAFLGIATQDAPEAALAVVDTTGVTYDLAQDPQGEMFRAMGATSMPATFFVTADGEVAGAHMGALTRGQLEGRIEAELGVETVSEAG